MTPPFASLKIGWAVFALLRRLRRRAGHIRPAASTLFDPHF
jgi:hypothetical protein